MKTLYSILALSAILLMSSCNGCCDPKTVEDEPDTSAVQLDSPVEISPNKLVVRFRDDMTDAEKEKLRTEVSATKKSVCSCGKSSIELWEIDTIKIKIEDAKRKTVSNQGAGGVNGDRQFLFKIPDSGETPPTGGPFLTGDDVIPTVLGKYLIASSETGNKINIAVIDTGLDLGEADDSASFLYPTGNILTGCNDHHTSGWNFVENNPDIRDSHSDGHGTFVTKTLMRELEASDIPYSILPIKAFDGEGKGSYWNMVCAFNYIKEIQAKKGDLQLVNASFGYILPAIDGENYQESVDDYNENSILASLINELGNKNTLIVASAGNDNLDTDETGKAHFPSGFTAPNLLGVGGYEFHNTPGGNVSKKIKGNYGSTSIDLAAPYQHGFSQESQNNSSQDLIIKSGTSYGVPFTAAKIAKFISEGSANELPLQIKNTFLNSLETQQNFIQKIGGGRYIDTDNPIINDFRTPKFDDGPVDGGVNQIEDQ